MPAQDSFESSRNRKAGKAEPIQMRSDSSVIKVSTSALTLDDDMMAFTPVRNGPLRAIAAARRLRRFFLQFRLLEVVVERRSVMEVGADLRCNDFARRQRGTVMDGNDADQVVIGGQHYRGESVAIRDGLLHAVQHRLFLPAQGAAIDPLVGDDGEM
jgi:hypothetical protein